MKASRTVFSDVPARVPTPKRRLSSPNINREERSFARLVRCLHHASNVSATSEGNPTRCAARASSRRMPTPRWMPPGRDHRRLRLRDRTRGPAPRAGVEDASGLRITISSGVSTLSPAPPRSQGVNNVGSVQKRSGRRIAKRRLDAGRCRVSKFACGDRRAR